MRHFILAGLLAGGSAFAQEGEAEAPEAEAPAEVTPESDADLAAIRAELAALRAKIEAQQAQLDAQAAELSKQEVATEATRKGLAAQRLKTAANNFKFELTGYYRARGYIFGAGTDDPDTADVNEVGGRLYETQDSDAQYLLQRLRLGAKVAYKDVASLNVHFQALDNVVWGDNADITSTALFAGNPSNTRLDGTEAPPFEVFRAWTEFKIPVGQIRVGRMASQWGLGILVNDGDGFRNDFGESNYGNSFDRFMFATRPVDIAQAITKKEEKNKIPLYFIVAFDRLVTDPLTQYYGYTCNKGVSRDTNPDRYDPRCDADGDGTTDFDREYTEERDPSKRQANWWADQRDDVYEMVYALLYRGTDIKYFGGIGDLTAGFYVIHRVQAETASDVVILDGWLDASIKGWILQFEGVGILGGTRAITLPNATADDPLAKTANIAGYAARFGYEKPKWKLVMESGFASGDDNPQDALFTGRALNPDYNVGLLLYEEVLRTVTQSRWTGSAEGLWSQGGVYNSHYINPKFYGKPFNNTDVILGFLMAFPDKPDGAVILCDRSDAEAIGCIAAAEDLSPIVGVEVDLAIKHRFHDHILASLETGYAYVTNRVPLQQVGLNSSGHFWTLQARVAWEF